MAKAQSKIGAPFYPLTEQKAKDWYQRKHLTTAGYLLAIKGIIRPPGVDLIIPNVLSFCKEWGISKSAFYRAVNALKASGELDWEATEGLILKSSETAKVIPLVSERGQCPMSETVSHERDSDSHERDSDSHERDSDSHERDSDIYIDHVRDQSNSDLKQIISEREKTLSFKNDTELKQEQQPASVGVETTPHLPVRSDLNQDSASNETTTHEDKSPAPRDVPTRYNASARCDEKFKPKSLLPYRISKEEFHPDFVEYRRQELEKSQEWRGRGEKPMTGDAETSLIMMEMRSEELVLAKWRAYLERQEKKRQAEQSDQKWRSEYVVEEKPTLEPIGKVRTAEELRQLRKQERIEKLRAQGK